MTYEGYSNMARIENGSYVLEITLDKMQYCKLDKVRFKFRDKAIEFSNEEIFNLLSKMRQEAV